MKNLLRKYSVIILIYVFFGLLTAPAYAQLHEFRQSFVKSYSDLKNERLSIDNKYGDVIVKTWNKKKILIEVEVLAQAKTTDAARQLVKRVHIDALRTPDEITCKSAIGFYITVSGVDSTTRKNKSQASDTAKKIYLIGPLSKQECTIRYLIHAPSDFNIKISNQFGNIRMGDYTGTLDIDEKFGDFTAGKLHGPVDLSSEQGNIHVGGIYKGKILAKGFGDIGIAELAGKVNTVFSLGNAVNIRLKRKIDSVSVDADNVNKVNISGIDLAQDNYLLRAIVSKVVFNNLKFEPVNLKIKKVNMDVAKKETQRQSDSIAALPSVKSIIKEQSAKDTLELKKKMNALLISRLKKMYEYRGGVDAGKPNVRIKVSFSVLSLEE